MANPDSQPIEVSFGDVFEQTHPGQPLMITHLFGNNSVNAQAIRENDLGEEIIVFGGGTTMVEHIKTIVERWNLQRMIEAAERGYLVAFGGRSEKLVQGFIADMKVHLEQEAQKPPVLLKP